ncbi:hypothetical protein LTS17_007064 [Exophiala oligosperma]
MSDVDQTTTPQSQSQPRPSPRLSSFVTHHPSLIPAPELASSRYNRQLLVPQFRLSGQARLMSSRVLIVGLGGLGCPAALYLAGAGVGTLGLMDADTVEVGNLHRQIAHTEAAARDSTPKVLSALDRCRAVNSEIEYVTYETRAAAETILDVVSGYDVVLDCTDNPATRYLISDACVVSGKVLVSGAAQRGEGSLVVLNRPPGRTAAGEREEDEQEEKGPCYRCVFPRPPPPEMVRGCSEIGILGPVVGVIGTLMAGEAVKILSWRRNDLGREGGGGGGGGGGVGVERDIMTHEKKRQQHTMLLYNTYAMDPKNMFRTITLRGRRKDCLACGDEEVLTTKNLTKITAETMSQGRLDYQGFCGVFEDFKILDQTKRVDAKKFLDETVLLEEEEDDDEHYNNNNNNKRSTVIVDVREEHEFELGTKVKGSINIPISKILTSQGTNAFDGLHLRSRPRSRRPQVPDRRQTRLSSGDRIMGDDGGMLNPESHVPVAAPSVSSTTFPQQGGMVNQESHIPVQRDEEGDFPTSPATRLLEERGNDNTGGIENEVEDNATSIYFVCQRGNDSQIAAQKMIEAVQLENERDTATQKKQSKPKWGWIGDVQGGFMAMERIRPS